MYSKPLVIGIGEFLWDILPTGRKAGGAPVNFAYHASQNGVEGWAVSAVGNDDAGRDLLAVTASYGIRTLVATVDKPTGTVDVSLCDGQPTYTIHEHVAWDYIPLTEEMVSLAREPAPSASARWHSAAKFRTGPHAPWSKLYRPTLIASMISTCVSISIRKS